MALAKLDESYRNMVLGLGQGALGFPGPGQHNRAYNRLKERQLRVMRRELKVGHHRNARVLALSGIRRAESARRAKRTPLTREGSLCFCNPLIEWTNADMAAYRAEHQLPQSDVAALIHRSGECNCGAFAGKGEREMLESLWPEWFEATIGTLEREAAEAGLSWCKWGQRFTEPAVETGPLCSDCDLRLAS